MSAAVFLSLIVGIASGEFDDAAIQEAHRKARHFIDEETQFHLGVLPTEQSNPRTVGLAETAQENLDAAIHMLQAADDAIPPKAAQVFASREFRQLVEAMRGAIEGRGRICFSGCGATGRLSILLETTWRQFWQELRTQRPSLAARLPNLEDRVESILTGGDYARVAELTGVDYKTACYALHETIEELNRVVKPNQEKPSAVALTIACLKSKQAAASGKSKSDRQPRGTKEKAGTKESP